MVSHLLLNNIVCSIWAEADDRTGLGSAGLKATGEATFAMHHFYDCKFLDLERRMYGCSKRFDEEEFIQLRIIRNKPFILPGWIVPWSDLFETFERCRDTATSISLKPVHETVSEGNKGNWEM